MGYDCVCGINMFLDLFYKKSGKLKIKVRVNLEEIAFDKKYISRDQLRDLATPLSKNEYGEYLMKIVDKKKQ